MFDRLIARMKGTSWRQSRVSYGPEPYRRAEQVSVIERVEAVLEGSARHLLRDVIGLDATRTLPVALLPARFMKELPVTAADVSTYVIERGLPRGFLAGRGLEIGELDGRWRVVIRGERGGVEFEESHESRTRAELAALRYYWWEFQPFVVGQLP